MNNPHPYMVAMAKDWIYGARKRIVENARTLHWATNTEIAHWKSSQDAVDYAMADTKLMEEAINLIEDAYLT